MNKEKKERLIHKIQMLKMQALQTFEDSLKKNEKSGQENDKGGYFANILQGMIENFVLSIKDMEIVFVYHVIFKNYNLNIYKLS